MMHARLSQIKREHSAENSKQKGLRQAEKAYCGGVAPSPAGTLSAASRLHQTPPLEEKVLLQRLNNELLMNL